MIKTGLYLLFFTLNLAAEASIGPLPPIDISLDAPVQIDESNTANQHHFMDSASTRLEKTLKSKQFPIELVLLLIALGAGYIIFKKWPASQDRVVESILTPSERIKHAQQLLSQAHETLSDQEALSFFSLMDPLAETFTDPSRYYQFSEQVKFAAYPPKKSELTDILAAFK